MDGGLTVAQRGTNLMISRVLDDLYWVMSCWRPNDDAFRPAFSCRAPAQHPGVTDASLVKAREFTAQRYHYQGSPALHVPPRMARQSISAWRFSDGRPR